MPSEAKVVIGGMATHKDLDVAAAIDDRGEIFHTKSFPVTAKGFRELLDWIGIFGSLAKVGGERAVTYGVG